MQDFLRQTISDLVAIPSPSGEERGVADLVFAKLRAAGLSPERDADDNVWVEVGPREAKGRLHVNGHMDTVVPVDGWETDPHGPVVKGGRLHGLGASDCKAGLAAMLWLAPRVRPKVRVLFSWTVCEEGIGHAKANGSRAMAAMGGDWAITVEPSCDGSGPRLSIGTQGHVRASVKFAGKAAHSSRPDLGENAVLAAARFCAGLERLNASFPERQLHGGAIARATVAPTIISGGKLSNIIPDSCQVTVSRRLAPGESHDTFRAELEKLLAGERASFEIAGDGPCALVDVHGPLFAAARRAQLEVCGAERTSFQRGRTDAVLFAAAGMDTMTIGPGLSTQCHVANEHVDLAAAEQCTRLLERTINGLGDK
ncbi:MAG TPA: M20/M25/M40 family metallo-hydrolase [Planctomycetota bacterium]|nr:M20/M25/M40 family metallo-hydrolase [Planctomycetota bacterium]